MNISIIGGGFCGTMLATRLIKTKGSQPLNVTLIEKNSVLGRGAAYSTDKVYHLLNVKASNMSAVAENPNHFIQWLNGKNIPLSESEHMPRKLYSIYLKEMLEEACHFIPYNNKIKVVRDEVTDIEIIDDKGYLLLNSGKIIEADKIILAMGNNPPAPLPFNLDTDHYCNNPWNCKIIESSDRDASVLMIGSGLTMVDLCMTLAMKNHKGKIISVSKHGLLPAVHEDTAPYPDFGEELNDKISINEIFNIVKHHIKNARENWRGVIDALRPHTQKLWMNLSESDKKSFMKHLNRIWSIARHRIPPEYHHTIQEMISRGQLEVIKGRLHSAVSHGKLIEVEIQKGKLGLNENFIVDYVINCTGPQLNYKKTDQPLIKNLLKKRVVESGPLDIGINALSNGTIIADGKKSNLLYTIGTPLTGILFETTAVPELRDQVKALAEMITEDKTEKQFYFH